MTENRLIGLLGGTFDPVHYGHLQPARLAKQQLDFDEFRLLPCHQPAHRDQPVASAPQRLRMLELALQEFPELILDNRELLRDGPSYSFDTLRSLHAEFPEASFCWMLGLDAFCGFDQWHRWREVLELTHLLVVQRPGFMADFPDELADLVARHQISDAREMRRSTGGKVFMIELNAPDISSTHLRECMSRSEPVTGLVPKPVEEWLNENPIYPMKS
jgi:nicotinate-nucleotide adenylyltransferase